MRRFNVQAARTGGMSDQDIQAFLAKNPDITPSQPLVKQQGGLSDYLPLAGGIAGGVLGGFAGPVGAIAGSAVGQGGGELLRQFAQKEEINPTKALGEAGWGALGGAGGELLGAGLKIGTKALSGTLARGGENLATRGFRPTPTALASFEKQTGTKFSKFLLDEGLAGQGLDNIQEKAKIAQDAYDALIASGTKISGDKYSGALLNEAVKYSNADDLSMQAIGDSIFNLAQNIEKKYGGKMIPASKLREQRILTDMSLPKNAFANAPVESGVSGVLRQTQKNLIDEAAGTGDTGKLLQKYYDTLDIAQKGQYKGAGSLPFGISTLQGGTIGAAAGNVPGAIAGMALPIIGNNPAVIGATSKAALKAAGAVNKIPAAAIRLSSQIAAQGFPKIIGGAPAGQENTLLPSADTATSKKSGAPKQLDASDQFLQAMPLLMMQDLANGGKNIPELSQIAAAIKMQKELMGGGKTSQAQAARDDIGRSVNQAVAQLASGDIKTGLISGPLEGLKAIVNKGDTPTLRFQNTIFQIKSAIAKARAGTAFTPNEEKLLDKYTPTDSDSMQQLQIKLEGLQNFFSTPTNIGTEQSNGAYGSL